MSNILVLDDDSSVLKLLGMYLSRSGYAVLLSSSIESARTQIRSAPGHIDLLIADVNLPVRSGVAVAAQLRIEDPRLCILLISGYPLEDWSGEDQALLRDLPPDAVRVLMKPFSAMDLINKVDELVGRPQSDATTSAG